MNKKLFHYLFATVCFVLSSSFAMAEYKILFLGDSLTEGLGLKPEEAFPSMIEAMLDNDNYTDITIISAGISGSTSASGLDRLQWYIRSQPDMLVLALGANDGLRGLSTEEMSENLAETIEFAKDNGVKIVLAGMQIPPNYGPEYTQAFAQVFPDLASEHQIDLLPFLLVDVAGISELNQADGIHPNLAGEKIVANTVYEFLKPLLPNH